MHKVKNIGFLRLLKIHPTITIPINILTNNNIKMGVQYNLIRFNPNRIYTKNTQYPKITMYNPPLILQTL